MTASRPMKKSKPKTNIQPFQKKSKSSENSNSRSLGPLTDLERHLAPEWWRTLFNSLYLKTDGDVFENSINTENDVNQLIAATGITPASQLLDLCCGQGRHAIELARRGYQNIEGIDRSRYLVRLARKRTKALNLSINFSEGDARFVKASEGFYDCIFLLGNSFGYFEKEEDDIAILTNLKRILKSNGKIVLDIVDGAWLKDNFEPRSWEWIDQQHFVNRERSLSADGKRLIFREVITHADKGVIADQLYAERLYSFSEIKHILEDIGFKDVMNYQSMITHSTRNQDLGMMENRLFITATSPIKIFKSPSTASKMPVTVILGDPRLPDPVKKNGQFNSEDFETIRQLKQALNQLDEFEFEYKDDHPSLIEQLIHQRPSFVFNLCDEGYNNIATQEWHVTALLEMLNIPYTGAGPASLALCYNKAFVRMVAKELDIPVPFETYYSPSDQAAHLPYTFPALVKPNFGDSSIGITQHAKVTNPTELMDYVQYLRETLPLQPLLIQEFLDGNEFSVGIIGNVGKLEALPLLEVDFSALPAHLPKILAYESKWLPDSPYWNTIHYKEASLNDEQTRKLIDYSCLLFERLECRDYARFDFRENAQGELKLLEVNPNPGWCWDGKFNLMAKFAGISYAQLLDKILRAAKERLNL